MSAATDNQQNSYMVMRQPEHDGSSSFYNGLFVGFGISLFMSILIGVVVFKNLQKRKMPITPQTMLTPKGIVPSSSPIDRHGDKPRADWQALVKAVVKFGDSIYELENLEKDAGRRDLLQYLYKDVDDVLAVNGVTPIDGDSVFSVLRHVTVPPSDVPEGSPIVKTINCGWAVGGKVLRRAKVVVQTEQRG